MNEQNIKTSLDGTAHEQFIVSRQLLAIKFLFSSPELRILLACGRDRELWFGSTPKVRDSRTFCQIWSSKSDWLRIWNEYSADAQKIGSVQSSRFLPQARRIVGSGDENVKAGVHPNFSEILVSLKRGWKGKKGFGTSPDSYWIAQWHPRLLGNCLECIYLFLTSNCNFKTTTNLPNFLFP